MEPIISPWLVYGVGLLDKLSTALFSATLVSATSVLLLFIIWSCCKDSDDEETAKLIGTFIKKGLIAFVCALTLHAVVPSKETAIAMIVADNITTDSVQAAGETVTSIKNELKADILDLINGVQEVETEE